MHNLCRRNACAPSCTRAPLGRTPPQRRNRVKVLKKRRTTLDSGHACSVLHSLPILQINRHLIKKREEVPNSPDRSATKTNLAQKLERQASHKESRKAVGKVNRLGGGITSPLGANSESRKYNFGAFLQYHHAPGRFDGWRQVTHDFSQERKQR